MCIKYMLCTTFVDVHDMDTPHYYSVRPLPSTNRYTLYYNIILHYICSIIMMYYNYYFCHCIAIILRRTFDTVRIVYCCLPRNSRHS